MYLLPQIFLFFLLINISSVWSRYWGFWKSQPKDPLLSKSTNDIFASTKTQDDKGNISGSVKILLEDGRVQTVSYTLNRKTGFTAKKTYEKKPPKEGLAYSLLYGSYGYH